MLGEDFDQTTDMAYEVWNWNQRGDPLAGVFDDREEAGTFEMWQIIETGGGLLRFYPPIDRYADRPPRDRARWLLSEALLLVEDVDHALCGQGMVDVDPLHELENDLHLQTVSTEYDRESFRHIVDYTAWSDTTLDIIRAYRTLARVRHLRLHDEKTLLTAEVDLHQLFYQVNEEHSP